MLFLVTTKKQQCNRGRCLIFSNFEETKVYLPIYFYAESGVPYFDF